MTDRPIIFSTPMVRALLDGRKTQTRRLAKITWAEGANRDFTGWHPERAGSNCWQLVGGMSIGAKMSIQYAPGDRLWVRETWSAIMTGGWTIADARRRMFNEKIVYRADGNGFEDGDGWWPSIHMPREFSRLTLTVTDVRVQRLQHIRGEDCIAEGVECGTCAASWSVGRSACNQRGCFEIRQNFRTLWNSLHGPDAWEANPWIVALTFAVHHGNIDRTGITP